MLSVIGVERSGSTRFAQILESLSFRVYDELFHPDKPWGLRKDDLLLDTLQNINFPSEVYKDHMEWAQTKKANKKFRIEAMNSFAVNPLRSDDIPLKLAEELSRTYDLVSITVFLSHLSAKTIAQMLSRSRSIIITSRTPVDSFISMKKAKIGGEFLEKGKDTTSVSIEIDPSQLLSYTNNQEKLYYQLGVELGLTDKHPSLFFLRYEDWSNLENNEQVIFMAGFLSAVMRESSVHDKELLWEPKLDRTSGNSAMLRQDKSSSWTNKVSNGEDLIEKLNTPTHKHCLSKYLLHESFLSGYKSSHQSKK